MEAAFAVRASPAFLLEGEEDFLRFAIDDLARDPEAGRAARHAGDAAKTPSRLRTGMDDGDARFDQERAGTGGGALGTLRVLGAFSATPLAKVPVILLERVHDRLVGIVVLLGELCAFAGDGRDHGRLVIGEGEGLHDLDVVEIVPVFIFTRRSGGAAAESEGNEARAEEESESGGS